MKNKSHEKLKDCKKNLTKFDPKKLSTDNKNSLLWETILCLKDENTSSVFQEFQDALGEEFQIPQQLLVKEEKISSTIKQYLELADTLLLPAILKALIAFSHDTSRFFYVKRFYDFIPILMRLISTNISCSDTLYNVFVCFLSLFCKFQKHLRIDFHKLFVKYKFCTLLSKKRQFSKVINDLAAQSLCPLLRIENNQGILNICLKRVSKFHDEADGLGLLFYHSMKHDELFGKLHSTALTTFSVFLDCLKEAKYNVMISFKVLSVTFKKVMKVLHDAILVEKNKRIFSYEDSTKCNPIQDRKNLWNIIFDKVDSLKNIEPFNESYIRYLIKMILQITEFKSCVLVNFEKCADILSSISKMNVTDDDAGIVIGKIAVNLMSSGQYKDVPDEVNNFFKTFFTESVFSPSVVFHFVDLSAHYDFFNITVLPFYLQFILSTLTRQDDPSIKKKVLDSLFKVVNINVYSEKKYPEVDDIKRIPLALEIVKLLKKLPRNDLDTHADSIVLRLVYFLKSELDAVRREARDIFMKELGGEFLPNLIQGLKSILVRDDQTQVLVYSLHAILSAVKDYVSANHIAPCVDDIMGICMEDIFGDKAEENFNTQITTKKGYVIMGILAQVIFDDKINIISPLKEKLQTHNEKVVNKVACCLRKIQFGLQRNKNISVERKSSFVYRNLEEGLEKLSSDISSNELQNQKKTVRKDSFLIEPEPRKVRLKPKTNVKTTFHVVVEFSLNVLADMIKHGQFLPKDKEHCSLLDPYVKFMNRVLLSEYPEVIIQALHVISGLIEFPLPSIDEHIKTIFGQMIVILNKFAKGNLYTLVQWDIKVLFLIIKGISSFKLEPDHSKRLIHYSKINLEDCNRYHSSFIILDALISKKVSCQELHNLMLEIRNMSVLSTNLNVINHARRTYLNYISIYPKKKSQLVKVFMFFVSNVSYSVISGRMSAIHSVQELIYKGFTEFLNSTEEIAVLFQITKQLFRKNPKEIKLLIKTVLTLLYDKSIRKKVLTDYCFDLLKGNLHRSNSDNSLAIHVGIKTLVPMLDGQSSGRKKTIINLLVSNVIDLLHPNRYQIETQEPTDIEVEQCHDMALTSLLDFILMVVENKYKNKNLTQWAESVNVKLWKRIKCHLLYPNLNVRFNCAVIFEKLFSSYPLKETAVPNVASTTKKARRLVGGFCNQLTAEYPVESPILNKLGLAIARNLFYLVRQGKKVPLTTARKENICKIKTDNINGSGDDEGNINFNSCPVGKSQLENKSLDTNSYFDGAYWVLRKVGNLAYNELKTKPKNSISIRDCLLNLIAELVAIFDEEQELLHAPSIIISFIDNHITRGLSDKSLPKSLATRIKKVSKLLREKIGIQRYSKETVRVQTVLENKQTKRKALKRERFISNPEMAMKNKSEKHADKREAKKRKFAELKSIPNKKRRIV